MISDDYHVTLRYLLTVPVSSVHSYIRSSCKSKNEFDLVTFTQMNLPHADSKKKKGRNEFQIELYVNGGHLENFFPTLETIWKRGMLD